ncbi:hypothetical protein AURDEDRAFT_185541 [Auricularia subglabra TFB-10046 SS5]|nr:hypothetical protein AURDEDRAFT_185541 [Auricularia subglabra TFB-10046 SS5]
MDSMWASFGRSGALEGQAGPSAQFAFPGASDEQTPSPLQELERLDDALKSNQQLEVLFDLEAFDGSVSDVLLQLSQRMHAVRALTIRSAIPIFAQQLNHVLNAIAPHLVSLSIHAPVNGTPNFEVLLPGSVIEDLCLAPELLVRWNRGVEPPPLGPTVKAYSSFHPYFMPVDVGLDTLLHCLRSVKHLELDVRCISVATLAVDLEFPPGLTSLTLRHNDVKYTTRTERLLSLARAPREGLTVSIYAGMAKSLTSLWSYSGDAPRELMVLGGAVGPKRQLMLRWPSVGTTTWWRGVKPAEINQLLRMEAVRGSALRLTLASVLHRVSEIDPLSEGLTSLGVTELTIHLVGAVPDVNHEDILKNPDGVRWACPDLRVLRVTSSAMLEGAPTASNVSAHDLVRLVRRGMTHRRKDLLDKIILDHVVFDEGAADAARILRTVASKVLYADDAE